MALCNAEISRIALASSSANVAYTRSSFQLESSSFISSLTQTGPLTTNRSKPGLKLSMDTRVTIRVVFLLLLSTSLHVHGVFVKTPTNTTVSKFNIWHKTKVRVHNNLGKNINLTLVGRTDDDLGVHLLKNGDSFQWRFHPNFIGTTTFYCGMGWKNVRGKFDIYVAQRDSERCLECVWNVTQDGVRGYSQEGGVEQIWFRWVPKPPIKF
ncbi:hypothetical protein DH2020_027765 [Rehmannia glutinosa]|uniref:S-protein homolog n=1 Tax=Rehmannia glutinosa TaxID=99300 RepID=A0ABR0VUA0_REHGL